VDYVTADGRTLSGYRIPAEGPPKGAILVAQGNAMLADQMLVPLTLLSKEGFSVFVFDFRGYGRSTGKPKLRAIVSDYTELAKYIVQSEGSKLYAYGISFGGIVLQNSAREDRTISKLVLDSSPSTVSDMGCPTQYDPVASVPAVAAHLMLIVGDQDRIVPPARSQALADKILSSGGRVERRSDLPHPLMESSLSALRLRLKIVAEFFSQADTSQ
jgi:alpha-beta hydrolase superfamily lysophospholipase